SWKVVPSPNPGPVGNVLYSVAAVSSTDVWAVGNDLGSYRDLFEHWNGSSWKVVPSPSASLLGDDLYSVAAVSSTDFWTVGSHVNSTGNSDTLLEHWNGSSWKVVPGLSPGPYGDILYSVAAVSSTDVWAVGSYYV